MPPAGGINIDYIHANPVRRGWVASPEHWRYSSAHEWLPGAIPVLGSIRGGEGAAAVPGETEFRLRGGVPKALR